MLSRTAKTWIILILLSDAVLALLFLKADTRADTLSILAIHVSLVSIVVSLPTPARVVLATRTISLTAGQTHLQLCAYNHGSFPGRIRFLSVSQFPKQSRAPLPNAWHDIAPHSACDIDVTLSAPHDLTALRVEYQLFAHGRESPVITQDVPVHLAD